MIDGVKYWVACSGGLDSVALVHLFSELKEPFGILHCNFQLRGKESDKDEAFVNTLAKELNVPILIKKFDTEKYKSEHKINTQLAARELRYNWFREIQNKGVGQICLAHHKDDQIETFFLQLRRGGKIKGLSGMPLCKDGFIRPLLNHSKSELESLANKNEWNWREDISNQSNDYKRNLYRNELIPLLDFSDVQNVENLVYSFQNLLSLVSDLSIGELNEHGALEFRIEDWLSLPIWLKQYVISENNLGKFPVHEIDKLCRSSSGASFQDNAFSVWRWKDKLVFYEIGIAEFRLSLDTFEGVIDHFDREKLYLDAERVKGDIRLRKWSEMDVITPLGSTKSKTVNRFLKDKEIPVYLRNDLPVLTDDSNHVLGVPSLGINDNYKVGEYAKLIYVCRIISVD